LFCVDSRAFTTAETALTFTANNKTHTTYNNTKIFNRTLCIKAIRKPIKNSFKADIKQLRVLWVPKAY